MMKDYKDIRISTEADRIVTEMREKFYFPSIASCLRFAMIFALSNYTREMKMEELDSIYPKDGSNFTASSTIDDIRGIIRTLIQMLYPGCETPYKYARVAIIYGLKKIKEKMDKNPSLNIADLIP